MSKRHKAFGSEKKVKVADTGSDQITDVNEEKPAAAFVCYGLFLPSTVWPSIQKRHVPHRLGLTLGVHQNPVPTMQDNGLVIGMADATANEDTRI